MNALRPVQLFCFCLLLLATNIAVAAKFERILALTPHACEMLYAIGASSQIVAAVSYCDYPEQAKKLPRVGNYLGINLEAALRFKPDAAIVMARHVKGVRQLERMGVKIIVSNPESFADIFHDMLLLGTLTGHRAEAQKLVQKQKMRLQKVRAKATSKTRVFYELWPDPLITIGKTSFINSLIQEAGGINVFADLPMETPHVNVESVVRRQVELIIIPLEKRSLKARITFWKPWLHSPSIRFTALDPDLLHRPGPRLIDGLELLQQRLQQARP